VVKTFFQQVWEITGPKVRRCWRQLNEGEAADGYEEGGAGTAAGNGGAVELFEEQHLWDSPEYEGGSTYQDFEESTCPCARIITLTAVFLPCLRILIALLVRYPTLIFLTYRAAACVCAVCIQFGFVAIFAVSYPLGAAFALLNNLFELRVDGIVLLEGSRRPRYTDAENIGAWMSVLQCSKLSQNLRQPPLSVCLPRCVF